jgi:hypothetical protein
MDCIAQRIVTLNFDANNLHLEICRWVRKSTSISLPVSNAEKNLNVMDMISITIHSVLLNARRNLKLEKIIRIIIVRVLIVQNAEKKSL